LVVSHRAALILPRGTAGIADVVAAWFAYYWRHQIVLEEERIKTLSATIRLHRASIESERRWWQV
jgi:hypothetical protein